MPINLHHNPMTIYLSNATKDIRTAACGSKEVRAKPSQPEGSTCIFPSGIAWKPPARTDFKLNTDSRFLQYEYVHVRLVLEL